MLMSSKIQIICKTRYVFIRKWQMPCTNTSEINPLMPGGNKKVTHTWTNLQLSVFIQNLMIEALDMFYLHTGADLGWFWHWYTEFGHIYLGT